MQAPDANARPHDATNGSNHDAQASATQRSGNQSPDHPKATAQQSGRQKAEPFGSGLDVASQLAFTSTSLVWQDLSYYVPAPSNASGTAAQGIVQKGDTQDEELKGKKQLLNSITGTAHCFLSAVRSAACMSSGDVMCRHLLTRLQHKNPSRVLIQKATHACNPLLL